MMRRIWPRTRLSAFHRFAWALLKLLSSSITTMGKGQRLPTVSTSQTTFSRLMTYTSAAPSKGTTSYPAARKSSSIACVSYWFTLQPRVWKATVFMGSLHIAIQAE